MAIVSLQRRHGPIRLQARANAELLPEEARCHVEPTAKGMNAAVSCVQVTEQQGGESVLQHPVPHGGRQRAQSAGSSPPRVVSIPLLYPNVGKTSLCKNVTVAHWLLAEVGVEPTAAIFIINHESLYSFVLE